MHMILADTCGSQTGGGTVWGSQGKTRNACRLEFLGFLGLQLWSCGDNVVCVRSLSWRRTTESMGRLYTHADFGSETDAFVKRRKFVFLGCSEKADISE